MYTVSTVITLVTMLIGCCVSELLCPHRNVWPKIVYCYFTKTTLFIVVLQELHCLPKFQHAYFMVVMDIYHYAKFHFLTLCGY